MASTKTKTKDTKKIKSIDKESTKKIRATDKSSSKSNKTSAKSEESPKRKITTNSTKSTEANQSTEATKANEATKAKTSKHTKTKTNTKTNTNTTEPKDNNDTDNTTTKDKSIPITADNNNPQNTIASPLASRSLEALILSKLATLNTQHFVRRGINEATKNINKKRALLVVIAADTEPIEIVANLPLLCDIKDVPYVFINGNGNGGGRIKLGEVCGVKSSAGVCALTVVDTNNTNNTNTSNKNNNSKNNRDGGNERDSRGSYNEDATRRKVEEELSKIIKQLNN